MAQGLIGFVGSLVEMTSLPLDDRKAGAPRSLSLLFFISGASALIYQVAWQRLLFASIGVDIESITIVVAVFMLGLGAGGLLGGWLADRFLDRLLLLFCAIELCIGFFGATSPLTLPGVGRIAAGGGRLGAAAGCFLFLAIPTVAMGATLPVLVTHVNRTQRNIGASVGALYFANTLGAAYGAIASGVFLFVWMDLNWAIWLAAAGNAFVAAGAWLAFRGRQAR